MNAKASRHLMRPGSRGRGRGRGRLTREEMARDAWRLLMKVAELHMEEAGARLSEMGLSPVMGHFLDEIVKTPPGPLSQLSSRMAVDPGWVTDVVDRLEARGDVRRVPSPDDRRIKNVEITEQGLETWRRMDDAIATAPPELRELNVLELRMLLRIAERLAAAAGIGPGPEPAPSKPG